MDSCFNFVVSEPEAYDRIKKFILRWEGGFGTDGRDCGGTMSGVTLCTFRQFFGSNKTVEDLKRMTPQEWDEVFRGLFYEKYKIDKITNSNIALLVVDWIYNAGPKKIENIRLALGLPRAGGMNQQLLDRLNDETQAHETFNIIWEARKDFYYNITEHNPENKKYIKGWMNRLNAIVWV